MYPIEKGRHVRVKRAIDGFGTVIFCVIRGLGKFKRDLLQILCLSRNLRCYICCRHNTDNNITSISIRQNAAATVALLIRGYFDLNEKSKIALNCPSVLSVPTVHKCIGRPDSLEHCGRFGQHLPSLRCRVAV